MSSYCTQKVAIPTCDKSTVSLQLVNVDFCRSSITSTHICTLCYKYTCTRDVDHTSTPVVAQKLLTIHDNSQVSICLPINNTCRGNKHRSDRSRTQSNLLSISQSVLFGMSIHNYSMMYLLSTIINAILRLLSSTCTCPHTG